jgi:thiol-disulfide isomerase/thioredoxin
MTTKIYLAFFYAFSILLLVSCTSKEQHSFSISGKVTELNNSYLVLSKVENIQKKTVTVIDTLKVNKKGEFNSVYFLKPTIYNLTFDTKTIQLAIDKGQNIIINGNTVEDLTIQGSVDTQLLMDYEAFRKTSLDRLVNSVRNKIKELKKEQASQTEIAVLREVEVENYKKHLDELIDFVKEKMGTSIAIYHTSTRWNGGENLPFLQSLVSTFEEKYPNLEITQKLKNRLQLLEKTSIGGVISNIEMPNATNQLIGLNAIKRTYTLIDIWASWCPPCRSESELLNNLYKTYKSKGFEIYGISLDSKRKNWLKAIENDARVWTNVSTVQGFKTPFAIDYGINALPTNFLIDSTGKIIAVNVHGTALKEVIDNLFK